MYLRASSALHGFQLTVIRLPPGPAMFPVDLHVSSPAQSL